MGTSITLTVPYNTPVAGLVATFDTTGNSVTVDGVAQVSGVTPNNFTNPVHYLVTAADNSTKDYTVTVTVALNDAKDITAFTFSSQIGATVINEAALPNPTISITVPYSVDVLASLTPTIVYTGVSVNPASGVAQNFTNSVPYTVTAEDGSTKVYTVTLNPPSSAKTITAFTLTTTNTSPFSPFRCTKGQIYESSSYIFVSLYSGTNTSDLVANFATTGVTVFVGGITGTPQISGTTHNSFATPLTYTVVAEDGTIRSYVVETQIDTTGGGPNPNWTGACDGNGNITL